MAGNIMAAFVVGALNMVFFIGVTVGKAKSKGSAPNASNLIGFWMKRNLFHVAIALIGSICIIPCVVISTWATSAEGETWGGSESSAPSTGPGSQGWAAHELTVPAIAASFQILISTVVAALNVRTVAPWEEKYADAMHFETMVSHGTMCWALVANLVGWISHVKLVHDMNVTNTPTPIDSAINAAMFFGFFYNFLLLFWFCLVTWCSKADFQPYLCPVCEGNKEVLAPGGQGKLIDCKVCHGMGETYLNP